MNLSKTNKINKRLSYLKTIKFFQKPACFSEYCSDGRHKMYILVHWRKSTNEKLG